MFFPVFSHCSTCIFLSIYKFSQLHYMSTHLLTHLYLLLYRSFPIALRVFPITLYVFFSCSTCLFPLFFFPIALHVFPFFTSSSQHFLLLYMSFSTSLHVFPLCTCLSYCFTCLFPPLYMSSHCFTCFPIVFHVFSHFSICLSFPLHVFYLCFPVYSPYFPIVFSLFFSLLYKSSHCFTCFSHCFSSISCHCFSCIFPLLFIEFPISFQILPIALHVFLITLHVFTIALHVFSHCLTCLPIALHMSLLLLYISFPIALHVFPVLYMSFPIALHVFSHCFTCLFLLLYMSSPLLYMSFSFALHVFYLFFSFLSMSFPIALHVFSHRFTCLDDFDFEIVNFPFLDGDVPRSTSYGVYISQLIRFARASSYVVDFNTRNKLLTQKLLKQGYRYHKLRKTFSKFYRRYYDLISKFQVGLKSLLRQGLSEPDFYGDLVYKLKKIVGSNNFSAQFIKIISHYKKIGYNINVLQQTACLVVNPITVGNFAFLFNCTPVGRTSDSMMVPTKRLIY